MENEFDELQSRMTGENAAMASRGMQEMASPSISSPPSVFAAVNLCQWTVEANDSFMPAGSSVPKLPAGVFRVEVDDYGRLHFVKTPHLTDDLVEIDDSASLRVIRGIEQFWKSRKQFTSRGILYKRGILLWGPPGSGKTATIALLTDGLVKDGGLVLMVQRPDVAVRALRDLRRIEPRRALIVVLEDIEEIIAARGEHDLLGLLDGEHQVDNVVHIATTNYPERLGARIVNRPSRFDEVIKVGMPSDNARRRYLLHAMRHESGAFEIDRWIADTNGMSIAHLRELVVAVTCLGRPYEETIQRLKKMAVAPKAGESAPLGFGAK